MPSWWPFWKSAVQRKAEEWEQRAAESGAVDGLFRRLGTDLNEEARVKAMAIARSQYDKQPEGGWISKTGRKHVEGFFEALFNLFVPGQVNLFMQLALLSSLAHVTLLGSWVLSELTEGTSEGTYVNDLYDAAMSTATASDTSIRLGTMYLAGHVLVLVVVLHVLLAGEVTPLTPLYSLLMLVAVVVGGPACALALSAHCEELARHKAAVAMHHQERQALLADGMQWVYLVALALIAAATTAALGLPSLDPTDGLDLVAFLTFYLWPLGLIFTSGWLSRLSAIFVVDWVGLFFFGLLHAFYSQSADNEGEAPPPPLLGVAPGYDLHVRLAFLCAFAFPNPYLGVALYLVLDSRHKARFPLLPDCTAALFGNRPPRAMATWQAREQGSQLI